MPSKANRMKSKPCTASLQSKLPRRETKRLPTDLKKYVTTKLAIAMSSKLRLATSNSPPQGDGKYPDLSSDKEAHNVALGKAADSRRCNPPTRDPSISACYHESSR